MQTPPTPPCHVLLAVDGPEPSRCTTETGRTSLVTLPLAQLSLSRSKPFPQIIRAPPEFIVVGSRGQRRQEGQPPCPSCAATSSSSIWRSWRSNLNRSYRKRRHRPPGPAVHLPQFRPP